MRWPPRRWFVGTVRDALVLGGLIVPVACTTPVPGTDEPVSPPSDVDVGLTARIHINTQTTDFARARGFYRMLGFTAGWAGFRRPTPI